MELEYAQVDVFAERALEGNMLAIFADGRGLSDEQMQALARETNLSETAFVLPGDPEEEARDGVRVRIFTTEEELPFAGHPTLGTASWLWWHHPTLRGAETIKLRLRGGVVPVRFESAEDGAGATGVAATMRQNDPMFGARFGHAEVAAVMGVPVEALDVHLPVEGVSTGMMFCIVPFRSVQAMQGLNVVQSVAGPWLRERGMRWFFCVAPAEPASGADFHNRMQFSGGEDPATGSASGCAIAYLVKHGVVASGVEVVFEQGVEIKRPSRLRVRASLAGEGVRDVFVGGRTIPVASGRFFLPG